MRNVLGSLLLLFTLTGAAYSQPDRHGRYERPFIDLDGNGTTDFVLTQTAAIGNEDVTTFEVMIVPEGENQVAAREGVETALGEKSRFVAAFARGARIGKTLPDTLEWASDVPPDIYNFVSVLAVPWRGPWPSEAPQYLGLKLVKDGNTYYGWAHLRLDKKYDWALSIRDKAYNPHPGQPIRAGHKP